MSIHPHPPDHCDPNGNLEKDQCPTVLTDYRDGQYAERSEDEWHHCEYESFDVVPHVCISAICLKRFCDYSRGSSTCARFLYALVTIALYSSMTALYSGY